ncbi:unnamed protein product [Protopolystoma xenopodis]|uniref:Uncharacterized protein n=1 Tax=Protopolystoma xenopodis TaxID=117903 RepID=A0A3S5AIA1_9PLAT|nr:unnamed protein product [Protopolystoma xenopodis]
MRSPCIASKGELLHPSIGQPARRPYINARDRKTESLMAQPPSSLSSNVININETSDHKSGQHNSDKRDPVHMAEQPALLQQLAVLGEEILAQDGEYEEILAIDYPEM